MKTKKLSIYILIIIHFFGAEITSQEINDEPNTMDMPITESPIKSGDIPMELEEDYREDTSVDKTVNKESDNTSIYIKGKATVIDGDTITIDNTKIRFSGIDAPESYYYGMTQYCERPNGKIWACGKKATAALKKLIGKHEVECTDEGQDRYGRTLGICYVDEVDLQAEMVKSGMAIAYLRYSRRYENEQNYAKKVKAGMWAGEFQEPEVWRRENRD